MQKFLILFLLTVVGVSCSRVTTTEPAGDPVSADVPVLSESEQMYNALELENIVDYTAFEQAYAGYKNIDGLQKDIVALIDFTKPSTEKRLYVLDLKQKKMLYWTHVAHGRNSGDNYATSFSNVSGSHKSSLGFFITENTYQGKSGYSLVLNGLEKGINDKAKERTIVIHGADYCNPNLAQSRGRLGRSFGCPALPRDLNDKVINTIKEGALLYIYAADKNYLSQSSVLSTRHIVVS